MGVYNNYIVHDKTSYLTQFTVPERFRFITLYVSFCVSFQSFCDVGRCVCTVAAAAKQMVLKCRKIQVILIVKSISHCMVKYMYMYHIPLTPEHH